MIWRNLILSSRVAYPVYAWSEFTVCDVHTWDDVDGWRLLKKLKIAEWKNKTAFCLHKIFSNLISTLIAHNMRQFFHTLKSQKKEFRFAGSDYSSHANQWLSIIDESCSTKMYFLCQHWFSLKINFEPIHVVIPRTRRDKREKRRRYRRGEHIKNHTNLTHTDTDFHPTT